MIIQKYYTFIIYYKLALTILEAKESQDLYCSPQAGVPGELMGNSDAKATQDPGRASTSAGSPKAGEAQRPDSGQSGRGSPTYSQAGQPFRRLRAFN